MADTGGKAGSPEAPMGAPSPRGGRRVRAYFWSRLQHRRLLRVQESLFVGAWMGLMSADDLDQVDDEFYIGRHSTRRSPIDYTSDDYNRQGWFDWEQRVIDAHFRDRRSLSLMAAGGGREVLALARAGARVDAWECQPSFVTAANELLRAEGLEPSVSFAPRNTVPKASDLSDGAIIGWGAYTLIRGREARVELLRAMRERMEVGAPLLVSFLARRPNDGHFGMVATVANAVRRLRNAERVEVGDLLDPNFLHFFVETEIAAELAASGFRMVSYSSVPYGHAVAVATDEQGVAEVAP